MTAIDALLEKAAAGAALTDGERSALLGTPDLLGLGMAADEARRRRHGRRMTFVRVATLDINTVDAMTTWPETAGEVRLAGTPTDWTAAIASVRMLTERAAGRVPITGFSLVDLETAGAPSGGTLPQVRRPDQADQFKTFRNYVALPRLEAFRIEYWALEEAKLQRMPPERELSRRIAVVVGGGSGIGREVALQIAKRGGHVVVADANTAGAEETARDVAKLSNADSVTSAALDLTSRPTIAEALRKTVRQFGGVDIVVNTAAIFPTPAPGTPAEDVWAKTLHINVTSNFVLAQEAGAILKEQGLPASLVLTSSANAVVPKAGSEAYDVSKAAINHLVRELAIGLGPLVRVNGIAPATVVAGSSMFPRDRVMVSLKKYSIAFDESESTEDLRHKLAEFYAQRTITRRPILPEDNANAICFLAGDQSAKTTGHVIPVDGGLPEAFLR